MFYIMNKDKLSIYSDSKDIIETTRKFMPQLDGELTLETDIVTAEELELHPNKVIVGDVPVDIDVPDYEQAIDNEGNLIYDDDGNPVMVPVMVDVPIYDEDDNIIGYKKEQSTHKETIYVNGIILNPNYEQEEEKKERQRINQLSLTKREVFLALYKDKGLTPDIIRSGLASNPEALIEFDYAERYFRGNPLIDIIGSSLGYSSRDMDYLFINKEFPNKEGEE